MSCNSLVVRGLFVSSLVALSCSSQPKVTPGTEPGGGHSGTGAGGATGGNGGGPGIVLPDAGKVDVGGGGNPDSAYSGGVTRPCVGLECAQTSCVMGACTGAPCAAGQKTTLRGKVYDPAGKVPLYNVVVYVPNAALDPIATGPSCDRCDSPVSGKPIATALTDTKGEFVLENVPVGQAVPLVLQIGKWRRQVAIPQVAACTENRADDANLYRLPRNQAEGHLPKIALATGARDRLECLLRKIGVDDAEFTPEAGAGRVNFFAGRGGSPRFAPTVQAGAAFSPATTFWSSPEAYTKYDMVILSCEGNQYPIDKSVAARQALQNYANAGGRVFASHWHNIWLEGGPAPWPQVATFVREDDPGNGFNGTVDATFPKAEALADWLVNVAASTVRGQLPIDEAKHTVSTVNPALATRWIHNPTTTPPSVQYFTFNTPLNVAAGMQCGRLVFTDLHVSAGDTGGVPWPTGCVTTDLSPQEKALEFMLFDLSSCIQPETEVPRPPIVP
jgi:hypothetical protein